MYYPVEVGARVYCKICGKDDERIGARNERKTNTYQKTGQNHRKKLKIFTLERW